MPPDTTNPYQVTFLDDEKPNDKLVGSIRFVRRRPVPCKLTGSMIRRATWHTFRSNFWRFIGLGVMQLAFALGLRRLSFITHDILVASFEYLTFKIRPADDPGSLIVVCYLVMMFFAILFFEISGYAVILDGTMRLLRRKTIFRKTPKKALQMLVAWLNCFCYGLICLLMLLPAWVLIFSSLIALELTDDLFLSNLWLAVFCVGLMLFALMGLFVFGRYAVGLHYIVDRNVGCLTALRRTAKSTRGNGLTIAVSFLVNCFALCSMIYIFVLFAFFIFLFLFVFILLPYIAMHIFIIPAMIFGLLTIFAYLHCWLAVTYHLTTGQYDVPSESETSDW